MKSKWEVFGFWYEYISFKEMNKPRVLQNNDKIGI